MPKDLTPEEKQLSDSTYASLEAFIAKHRLNGAVLIAIKGDHASNSVRVEIQDIPMVHDVLKKLLAACEEMMAKQGLQPMEGNAIRERVEHVRINRLNPEVN